MSRAIREKVAAAAGRQCGYCRTSQTFTAMPLHLEHIVPIAAGGSSTEENLWLACPLCNGYKGAQTSAPDPESGEDVALFKPRRQTWSDHFRWSDDGTLIVGSSAVGRATVRALKLDNEFLVQARARRVAAGWHPPST